jgi:ubiquinol-cytochrome c reductase cytochrome b subunit
MKFKLFSVFKNHLINYPTPVNLNINWCYGSSAGFFIVVQIVTGLLLAAQYIAENSLSFENIEYIMREVNSG